MPRYRGIAQIGLAGQIRLDHFLLINQIHVMGSNSRFHGIYDVFCTCKRFMVVFLSIFAIFGSFAVFGGFCKFLANFVGLWC